MYIPLCVKTDFSLLQSLITIPKLMKYLNNHNIPTCAIVDDNLYGSIAYYNECLKNNIKPIIGLEININTNTIYLYAKNYNGYKNLLKINTLKQIEELNFITLEKYREDIVCVIPFNSNILYESLNNIYDELYIGYKNDYEKNNASIIDINDNRPISELFKQSCNFVLLSSI